MIRGGAGGVVAAGPRPMGQCQLEKIHRFDPPWGQRLYKLLLKSSLTHQVKTNHVMWAHNGSITYKEVIVAMYRSLATLHMHKGGFSGYGFGRFPQYFPHSATQSDLWEVSIKDFPLEYPVPHEGGRVHPGGGA